MTQKLPRTVLIVGAGLGGLALANLLAKAGVQVTICDQLSQAGGRAGRQKIQDFTFDTGPSWYLMPEIFEHYFSLLGEKIHDHIELTRLEPAYKVFYESTDPLTIHANPMVDAKTFEHIESGAGNALKNYIFQAKRTYEKATKYFLYNNFLPGAWGFDPGLLSSLPRIARLSSQSLHHYVNRFVYSPQLQQILEYPAVFLGASPYQLPAVYSLLSYMDLAQGVFYPKGGIYCIVEALENIGKKLGVTYHYGTPVSAIITENGRAVGLRTASGTLRADVVVSNADIQFTEMQLLPPESRTYGEAYWRQRTAGPSAVLMYLGVKGSLPQLVHHNLLFVDDWQANFEAIYDDQVWPIPASMYICKPSATDPSVAPAGHENLFVLVPVPAKTDVAAEVSVYAERYLDQLATMINVPDLRQRLVVQEYFGPDDFARKFNAWNGTALGMAHTLSQTAILRPLNKSRKVSNLYYVGANTMPGIGMPSCLVSAELVYKRMVNDRSMGSLGHLSKQSD